LKNGRVIAESLNLNRRDAEKRGEERRGEERRRGEGVGS
jgi:hypothetical protein